MKVRQTGQLNDMMGENLHSENILPAGSDHTSYQLGWKCRVISLRRGWIAEGEGRCAEKRNKRDGGGLMEM